MNDVRAVMDATGSGEAIIVGCGDDGAALAAVFAATYPHRTRGVDPVRGASERAEERGLSVGIRPGRVRRMGA